MKQLNKEEKIDWNEGIQTWLGMTEEERGHILDNFMVTKKKDKLVEESYTLTAEDYEYLEAVDILLDRYEHMSESEFYASLKRLGLMLDHEQSSKPVIINAQKICDIDIEKQKNSKKTKGKASYNGCLSLQSLFKGLRKRLFGKNIFRGRTQKRQKSHTDSC